MPDHVVSIAAPDRSRVLRRATWRQDLVLLAVVAVLWFCSLLGVRPLANPDEGRYAEIPREMAVSGDFVTPRLNGVKYFEKPPLLYWLSALTFRVSAVSEFTARLWGGLFAALGVLLTYSAARMIYGRAAGIASAVVLATSLLYAALAQVILMDMAVAVTMAGALFSFLLAVREPPGRRRWTLFLSFYAFMALATLTKGLIGFLLPGAVVFLWLLLLGRWRVLRPFHPFSGAAVALAIAAPWHVLAARANPDFLWFYFVHEHFLRFTTSIHGRVEPWWYFVVLLQIGMFPWVIFGWPSLRDSLRGGWRARREHAEAWFLMIWVVFIVVFFSISQSKLPPYILPVIPACAVLIGSWLAKTWQSGTCRGFSRGAWLFPVIATLLACGAIAVPAARENSVLVAGLIPANLLFAAVTMAGSAVTALALWHNRGRLALGSIAASWAAAFLCLIPMSLTLEQTSTKPLAMILNERLDPDDRIFHVGIYAQDMPVYTGRMVSVVDYAGELSFGIAAEPKLTSARFISREEFSEQWREPGRSYAVLRKADYGGWFTGDAMPHEVLGETRKLVLVVNRTGNS